MTEAGEKWAVDLSGRGLQSSAQGQADFWINAFCAEVEMRAEIVAKRENTGSHGLGDVWLEAFGEIKRELLGDWMKRKMGHDLPKL